MANNWAKFQTVGNVRIRVVPSSAEEIIIEQLKESECFE
jgi:hypothetical protein